jgi:diacylglycerol kinase
VGFNPFRQQEKTATDMVIVAVFMVIIVAVIVWAFVG